MKRLETIASDGLTRERALDERDSASPTAPTVALRSLVGPSCAGGGHRRCLLTAEQCPCACHRDAEPAPYARPPRNVPGFTCAVCGDPFPTAQLRAFHMQKTHPVTTVRDERHHISTCALKNCPVCYGDRVAR